MTSIEEDLQRLADRLANGAREYGNRSMLRTPSAIVAEIEQELIDLPGWTYVLWAIAQRKLAGATPEDAQRAGFVWNLRHRMSRNDRANGLAPGASLHACLADLEVLAMDMFDFADRMRRRLQPIARAIEAAHVTEPPRGRRGSIIDPRSSD